MADEVRQGARRSIVLFGVLAGVWLLWSGPLTFHHAFPLAGLAVVSCILVLALSRRMRVVDEEGQPTAFGIRPILYLPWLAGAILKANLDVTRRILSPRLPVSPTLVSVPAPQRSDLAKVIFANSITLTPGTVSVEVEGDTILVHAISEEGARDLLEGEMSRRVCRVEGDA